MSFQFPKLAKLLGTAAAIVFVGGVHLEIAAGRDLKLPTDATDRTRILVAQNDIDRSHKTDRATLSRESPDATTVVINNSALPMTTIAVRVLQNSTDAGAIKVKLPWTENGIAVQKKKKQMVACEGVVSTLTDVAKHLAPGRCVT